MSEMLTKEDWHRFEMEGYVRLGKLLTDSELSALAERIDSIMLGTADLDYSRLMMQREAGEGHAQSEQTWGFKGSTLNYRKIQNLELDPLFLAYMRKPLFRSISHAVYGKNRRIACFRAMFMNKPAYHGSRLRYH